MTAEEAEAVLLMQMPSVSVFVLSIPLQRFQFIFHNNLGISLFLFCFHVDPGKPASGLNESEKALSKLLKRRV